MLYRKVIHAANNVCMLYQLTEAQASDDEKSVSLMLHCTHGSCRRAKLAEPTGFTETKGNAGSAYPGMTRQANKTGRTFPTETAAMDALLRRSILAWIAEMACWRIMKPPCMPYLCTQPTTMCNTPAAHCVKTHWPESQMMIAQLQCVT